MSFLQRRQRPRNVIKPQRIIIDPVEPMYPPRLSVAIPPLIVPPIVLPPIQIPIVLPVVLPPLIVPPIVLPPIQIPTVKKVIPVKKRVVPTIKKVVPVKKQAAPTIKEVVSVKKQVVPTLADITVLIINFKTLALTRTAWQSMRQHYNIPVLLVDNASGDGSTSFVAKHSGILNTKNLGHGPAMHQAIKTIKTRYVLTLDSDCIVEKKGFVEQMLAHFADPLVYAVGWLRWVDRWSGVPREWHLVEQPSKKFVAYVHPAVALYDLDKYRQLSSFFHHGAPALLNMIAAEKRGYKVVAFPVFNYVKHLIAGTRRMYGGRWDPRTNEKPGKWKPNASFPI